MNGTCSTCGKTFTVSVRRGDKITNHACPDCGTALQGVTAGRSRGRYLCPINGCVVTLGLTGVRLDQPSRLVFQPGVEFPRVPRAYTRTEPNAREQAGLDRVAGRILGIDCVIATTHDPHLVDQLDATARETRLARPGLLLVPAEDIGDPADWIVNQPLSYRPCAACGALTPDLPERRPPCPWRPRRTHTYRGGGRHRRPEQVPQGPYPAGSLACTDCAPHRNPFLAEGRPR